MKYLCFINSFLACVSAFAAGDASFLESKLQHELLAPCCYHETLDRHNSDIAVAMRAEIHQMLAAGKTEREILNLYKSRYGTQVLAEPEGTTWWVGTLIPIVTAVAALVWLTFWLTRRVKPRNGHFVQETPLHLPDDEIFNEI